MARLIVQARNNEDTPTTCVRLCTSIEKVEMLQHQENDERCRDGHGISRVSPEQLQVLLRFGRCRFFVFAALSSSRCCFRGRCGRRRRCRRRLIVVFVVGGSSKISWM